VSSQSILIVEDDHDIRVAIREVLEAEGYEILSAANGRDGIEILKKSRPRLVLLDLMMPIMDGYEFLHRMRHSPGFGDTPVVGLTASGIAKKPEGATELRAKPLGLDSLLQVTRRYCPGSAAG
jgi:CheY-like chemotaxis protein